MITQNELKSFVNYNPNTGVFVCIKKIPNSSIKVGSTIGKLTKQGYLRFQINGYRTTAHRFAWLYEYGYIPNEIDHINHDRTDNRICNLRDVTRIENQQNTTISSRNTSGCMGVHFSKSVGMWNARITVNKKRIQLGYFISFSDAVDARKNAEVLYGFHANHNITQGV